MDKDYALIASSFLAFLMLFVCGLLMENYLRNELILDLAKCGYEAKDILILVGEK